MKLCDVTKLLDSIAHGLTGLSKDTANGLSKLHSGMEPFHDQTVEQFADFLQQCEEYKRTGVVHVGKKSGGTKKATVGLSVADAADMVRSLLAEINHGTVTTSRIDSLLNVLAKDLVKPQVPSWKQLLVELRIHVKPTNMSHAKELVRQMLNSQLEMFVKGQAYSATA